MNDSQMILQKALWSLHKVVLFLGASAVTAREPGEREAIEAALAGVEGQRANLWTLATRPGMDRTDLPPVNP